VVRRMLLYLIRHGQADDPSAGCSDTERALTASGIKELRRVARRLVELGVRFDRTATSPLLRARQTADVLGAEGVTSAVEEEEFLAGRGTLDDLRAWLGRQRRHHARSVAVVGHQPDLGEWAEALLCGEARGRIQLKKAGIVALELPDSGAAAGSCRLVWMTSPKLLL
jgi:phosphohistidine phosphatase